jgi:hypothetical protein
MRERTARVLRMVGVQLAVVAAAIHLWWGVPRAVVYLRAGTAADPRPYLFVVSALLVFAGVVALYAGANQRALFGLGAGVMALYAVGYVQWHLGGHGGIVPGVEGYGHGGPSVVGTLLSSDHLFRPLDALAMSAELGALACFLALLLRGPPSIRVGGTTDATADD